MGSADPLPVGSPRVAPVGHASHGGGADAARGTRCVWHSGRVRRAACCWGYTSATHRGISEASTDTHVRDGATKGETMFRLDGKVALVTGSGRGAGLGIIRTLAKQG